MDLTLSSILASTFILASIIVAIRVVNWVWFRPKKLEKFLRKQGLQGNPYRLFVGDVNDLTSIMQSEQHKPINISDYLLPHILPFYYDIIQKHGKNSFAWIGPIPRINISDPELIKEIFTKHNIYQKTPDPIGDTIIGGLLFLEDDKWATHRKIINSAFHQEKLKKMVPAMYLSCSDTMQKWEALFSNNRKSMEVDVWPYLEDLSGDVISRTAFGSRHEEGRRIFELQREQVKLVLKMMQFNFIPGWRYLPTKTNRRMKAIIREMQSVLRGIINQRERVKQSGGIVNNEDLLGVLMEASAKEIQEHGNKKMGLTIDEIIDECKFFYFAGSETTSSVLVWAMVLLSKYKHWQDRAREEVLQLLGRDGQPTYENINQLKTVTMIVYEVLRLYAPAPLTTRAAKKPVKLGNMILPAGVELTLLMGIVHYDQKIWGDDAHEFRPDRFSEGISGATKTPFSFLPFIAGPRVCIGQNFAMIEATMALAMMLQRFSFELSPSYKHTPFAVMTLQPQFGAPLILHKL